MILACQISGPEATNIEVIHGFSPNSLTVLLLPLYEDLRAHCVHTLTYKCQTLSADFLE